MKSNLIALVLLALGTFESALAYQTNLKNDSSKEGTSSISSADGDEKANLLSTYSDSLAKQIAHLEADLKNTENDLKILVESLGEEHRITQELKERRDEFKEMLSSLRLHQNSPPTSYKHVLEGLKLQPKYPKYAIYDRPEYPTLVTFLKFRNKNFAGFEFFYRGRLIRRFLDTNSDNKLDQWIYFSNGLESYREGDSNEDEEIDWCQRTHRDIVDLMIDFDKDGEFDRILRGKVSDFNTSPSIHALIDRGFEEADLANDEQIGKIEKSKDLKQDKLLMWQTVPNKKRDFHVSSVSAINASRRVFETVKSKLVGKQIDEIRQIIGHRERPKYGYHDAFWPVEQHAYVYRFDCGKYGWQYNLYLDDKKTVERVEIRWIH